MYWVRIDNRLVHGQIIETWLPYLGSRLILVVNDELAGDALRQEIIQLAVPLGVELQFSRIDGVLFALQALGKRTAMEDILLLFASCSDANRAHQDGLTFASLNIGNLHYGPGKQQLCPHVALSSEDISCLRYFTRQGVSLDFRCVPNDSTQVRPSW
ncbi:MAG TPA: PTS mannose/fructose/sorbose transporter subunit IIB [Desulfonatronum sp.]|nr:PTS mannose/fructose/sorbose transporter subunit IIB [Desulfonatronum sp.]